MLPEQPPPPRKRRPRRLWAKKPPPLTEEQILAWADAYHARTGRWPTRDSGNVPETLQETWCGISLALRRGHRGLPGGPTLGQLLFEKRGVRNCRIQPSLTVAQILAWMDAHHQRTGQWPTNNSGVIPEAPAETWRKIDKALRKGGRGFPGADSLACLRERERGVRNAATLPALSLEQILAWADSFFADKGRWPVLDDGPIAGSRGETWFRVNQALYNGGRGQPGGSSLPRLLDQERGVRNRKNRPRLTEEQILAWADEHHRRTGQWPTKSSGPIAASADESWSAVDSALMAGLRGLPGKNTLTKLLGRRLGVRNAADPPRLTVAQVLSWADAHFERTGRWPNVNLEGVTDAPEESWFNLDASLRCGGRGLPRGLSLARLLDQERGVRNEKDLPPLTEEQILAWADEYQRRTGRWPSKRSGPIPASGGETWMAVAQALERGRRGWTAGNSLAQLRRRHGKK